MIDALRTKVNELLTSGAIDGFLGLAWQHGHIAPRLFVTGDDLSALSLGDNKRPGDARYPLNKYLINLFKAYPDKVFGVLVRGCDDRGLKALYTWNQLSPNKVVPVGIACPQELADRCECSRPYPDEIVAGEQAQPAAAQSVAAIEQLDPAERFSFWMNEFIKCIKCYGCSNVCPMCFCNECSLTCDDLIRRGELPPEIPVFHHTRAMHMVGRCIDCGLCEEACPSNIPLRTLYKKMNGVLETSFGYTTGRKRGQRSPLNLLDPAEGSK